MVLIPDHYIFTADPRANRNVDILRDMAHKYNIKYFYDISDRSNFKANPDYKGVCHVALAQEGHCKPGEVLFGTDSHTCNAGAFGQFATGVGNTDAGFILGTGKLLIKVGQHRAAVESAAEGVETDTIVRGLHAASCSVLLSVLAVAPCVFCTTVYNCDDVWRSVCFC